MKNRNELLIDAKGYFAQNPNTNMFYATGDGMFFGVANRADGDAHAKFIGSEYHEISRDEAFAVDGDASQAETTGSQAISSEPTDKWKKEDIASWMTSKAIAFDVNDTKAILLSKITDSKKAPEPEAEPTLEWEINKVQEWMTAKVIAFTEADNTVEALIALIQASKTPKE
jgi:hypothetical protein